MRNEIVKNSIDLKFISVNQLSSIEKKRSASDLIIKAIPEFYDLFFIPNNTLINHISKEIGLENTEFINTECLFDDDDECQAVLCSLSSKALRIAQMWSVMKLMSLSSENTDKLKSSLKKHSNYTQPIIGESYYLSRMTVNSKYQRLGLGKLVLDRFIEIGSTHETLSLHVHAENYTAISLYKNAGFEFADDGLWKYKVMKKERILRSKLS